MIRSRPQLCLIALAIFVFYGYGGTVTSYAQSQTDAPAPSVNDPQTSSPQNPSPDAKDTTTPSAQEIANQANNPAAPVTLIQFRSVLLPSIPERDGVANTLQVQPVVPIGPFHSFPLVQLVKVTFPFYNLVPGTANGIEPPIAGASGIGDLQVFDLLTIKQSWGRWGFGPALVFPTASDNALGAGKWQAGPAVALIYTGIKNLAVGAIAQNPFSYAGSPDRPDINQMLITPTLTYNLKDGWFAGLSDYNWTFDWKNNNAVTLPLGVQVGKVIRLGKQPFSLSVEAGGTVVRPSGAPNPGWILGFELSPIFNFHVGPHQKVRVRGAR